MSSFFPKHYKLSVTFRPVKLVMTFQNVFPVYITCVFIPKVLDLTPHAKIIFRPLIYYSSMWLDLQHVLFSSSLWDTVCLVSKKQDNYCSLMSY